MRVIALLRFCVCYAVVRPSYRPLGLRITSTSNVVCKNSPKRVRVTRRVSTTSPLCHVSQVKGLNTIPAYLTIL
ncbi:uncharacterized protein F4812DRAFT_442942 [Daldinia caldariorum]|uniref:uncharacterized protein n=1 Tax=Daldinia caldariorum TaxID=326644 RepID=UPI002008C07A|nr:uncharacterized protein F4812DRAFT_442942 [Daldinia caldariorum]KAI1464309.1 hypothetical protein F4812DRAFT_442942 [Daldinia caldariorum]